MFHNFLADFVAHVGLLDLNLAKLCLLLFVTGVIFVYWFKRLKKDTRKKGVQSLRANCWFCNEDVDTQPEKADSWRCPYCDQYNGFTEDGDYNQPLTDQFEVKEFKTPTVCSQSEFTTGTSVLCESCAQNQVLKLRQIAAFVPFNDANYDAEVEEYRAYLEHRYTLCDKCRKQVSNYLTDQDKKLVSKMTDDQLGLLDRLKRKIQAGSDGSQMRPGKPQQPLLPCLMFGLCVCTGIINIIFSLALYSASSSSSRGASLNGSYISGTDTLYLSVLPYWLAVWGEQITACWGCAFCFCGLLTAGKHSLYPVDAIHLLLWLTLTLLTSVTPAAILSWSHLPPGKILIAGTNLILSLTCCLRSRHPRHFTVPTLHKKQMNHLEAPVKAVSQNGDFSDSARGVHKRQVSPPPSPLSPASSLSDGVSQVEHVQQNMEGLTLGLTRRSASTSSVWSLPAAVTVSTPTVCPDSTTDQLTPSGAHHSQNILFPSKLSFLNLDPDVTASDSRSPSPWMQINESLAQVSDRDYQNNLIKWNQATNAEAHLGSAFRSHRHGPPASDRSGVGAADRSQTYTHRHDPPASDRSAVGATDRSHTYTGTSGYFASSVLPDVGPCDSQTPESGHTRLSSGHTRLSTHRGGDFKNQRGNVSGRDSNPHISLSGQDKVSLTAGPADMFTRPELAAGKMGNNTPRRSQRIANMGRLPKPWPLKKSWSCNIVCNSGDMGRPEVWQTKDVFVSSQVWGRHFTDSSGDSTLARRLLPVQEVRVASHACQTAVADNEDEKLKCGNFLVKHHPRRKDISRQMMELSDDDCDESDGLKPRIFKNKTEKGFRRNDLSWTWLVIGVFLGASLASNVFLVCHRWWAHVEPL